MSSGSVSALLGALSRILKPIPFLLKLHKNYYKIVCTYMTTYTRHRNTCESSVEALALQPSSLQVPAFLRLAFLIYRHFLIFKNCIVNIFLSHAFKMYR